MALAAARLGKFAGRTPGAAGIIVAALATGAYVGWDFYRVGQLYKPLADRPPSLRQDTVRKVGNAPSSPIRSILRC